MSGGVSAEENRGIAAKRENALSGGILLLPQHEYMYKRRGINPAAVTRNSFSDNSASKIDRGCMHCADSMKRFGGNCPLKLRGHPMEVRGSFKLKEYPLNFRALIHIFDT